MAYLIFSLEEFEFLIKILKIQKVLLLSIAIYCIVRWLIKKKDSISLILLLVLFFNYLSIEYLMFSFVPSGHPYLFEGQQTIYNSSFALWEFFSFLTFVSFILYVGEVRMEKIKNMYKLTDPFSLF